MLCSSDLDCGTLVIESPGFPSRVSSNIKQATVEAPYVEDTPGRPGGDFFEHTAKRGQALDSF
jgi:hypothetical protein